MKVKVGAHLMIWTEKVEHYVDYFNKAKEIGFEGVEIPLLNVQAFRPDITKVIRRELDKLGLQATCGTGLGREKSLISSDKETREKGKKYLKRCIDICLDLNSHVLAGVLYGAFGVSVGRSRTEEEWARAVESLQEIAKYAAQREVVLCLEAINRYETYFVNTAEDTAHLVKDVGKDNVKLHLDTYQMNIEEKDFYTPIVENKEYLGYIHCSENDRGIPGTGHVDWDGIFRALSEMGYKGWLVIESFYGPIKEVGVAASVWRKLANNPDDIAIQGLNFLRKKMKEYSL